jgi:hypothetical protein
MNPSTRHSPRPSVATVTATRRAPAIGIVMSIRTGAVTMGWAGLFRVAGSQSWHKLISLARSVTISENMHHVGGLGDPPKVRGSDR